MVAGIECRVANRGLPGISGYPTAYFFQLNPSKPPIQETRAKVRQLKNNRPVTPLRIIIGNLNPECSAELSLNGKRGIPLFDGDHVENYLTEEELIALSLTPAET